MSTQQVNPVDDNTGRQEDSEPAQAQNAQAAAGDDQTIPTSRSLVTTPEEASDSDLIEKEWVLKAKQIVEHTAEDPFNRQEQLSHMKADYMKKRYNKDIGTT